MKWKGRRQAWDNIEIRDKPEEPQDGDIMFPTGEIYHSPKSEFSKDDIKVSSELGRLNREGKTPTPTPNPRRPNVVHTQVTPGKWVTKSK